MFFLIKDIISIFNYINVVIAIQHSMYKGYVRKDSILRTIDVSTISSCYYECWDNEFRCCAVGFLPSQINQKKQKKNATCHMIKCNQDMYGDDDLELEIFEIPNPESKLPEKLLKNGTANQTSTHLQAHAWYAVDDDYGQGNERSCAHLGEEEPGSWKYVLPYNFLLDSVQIYNLISIFSWRLSNCNIYVINPAGNGLCGNTGNMTDVKIKRIYCQNSLVGNGIIIKSERGFMTFCEIDMYGKVIPNEL